MLINETVLTVFFHQCTVWR